MPKVSVSALSLLLTYMDGKKETEAEGGTVREVLDSVTGRYRGLQSQLFKGNSLNEFINIFVNDDNIRDLDGLETKVAEGDRLLLLPAVAGG